MTVYELRELLLQFDPQAIVVVSFYEDGFGTPTRVKEMEGHTRKGQSYTGPVNIDDGYTNRSYDGDAQWLEDNQATSLVRKFVVIDQPAEELKLDP